jgi:hypothetical protein
LIINKANFIQFINDNNIGIELEEVDQFVDNDILTFQYQINIFRDTILISDSLSLFSKIIKYEKHEAIKMLDIQNAYAWIIEHVDMILNDVDEYVKPSLASNVFDSQELLHSIDEFGLPLVFVDRHGCILHFYPWKKEVKDNLIIFLGGDKSKVVIDCNETFFFKVIRPGNLIREMDLCYSVHERDGDCLLHLCWPTKV